MKHSSTRDFAATARYFEERRRKASNSYQRDRLARAAELYRSKAEAAGQPMTATPPREHCGDLDIPSRRRRLIDLFRSHEPNRTSRS
jgi:hypothetical protein